MAEKQRAFGRLALQPRAGTSRQMRRSKQLKVQALREKVPEGVGQLREARGRQLRAAKQIRTTLPTPQRQRAIREWWPDIDIDIVIVIKVQFARRMQPRQLANLKPRVMAIPTGIIALPPVKVSQARVAQVRQRAAVKSAQWLTAK